MALQRSTCITDVTDLFVFFRQKLYANCQAAMYSECWTSQADYPYLKTVPANYSLTEGRQYYSEDWCLCCGEYLLWTKSYCQKCPVKCN